MKCQYCGIDLESDWNYCPMCTKSIIRQNPASPGKETRSELPAIQSKTAEGKRLAVILAVAISLLLLFALASNNVFSPNSGRTPASASEARSAQSSGTSNQNSEVLKKVEIVAFYKDYAAFKKKILDFQSMHDSAASTRAITEMNTKYRNTYIIANQTIASFNADEKRMIIVGQDPTDGPPDMIWEVNDELAATMVLNFTFMPNIMPVEIEIPSSLDLVKNAYVAGNHRFGFRARFKEFRNDSARYGPHAAFTFMSLEK